MEKKRAEFTRDEYNFWDESTRSRMFWDDYKVKF